MSFRFDVLLRNGQQAVKGDPSSFLSLGTTVAVQLSKIDAGLRDLRDPAKTAGIGCLPRLETTVPGTHPTGSRGKGAHNIFSLSRCRVKVTSRGDKRHDKEGRQPWVTMFMPEDFFVRKAP